MPILKVQAYMEELGFGEVFSTLQNVAESESVLLDYQLATGTSNEVIPQSFTTGIATPYVVLIASDQDVSWRLAATDTLVSLKANGFALLFRTAITNLLMTNASGSTANITVWLTGV
jgi:hypothetical protein